MGPLLLDALHSVFVHGPGDDSWAEGVIVLIYKAGKGLPVDDLSSYRPITLLNTDYKLASKAIVQRMQAPLDYLIDSSQCAFIQGRWIGDNVLLQQTLAEYLHATQQPGVSVMLDIKQAYDRVDRQWLRMCAEAMGLPQGMRRWIECFMDGTSARALVNGWLTPAFPVRNGLPQGGPLCPPLWNLQLQPFTAALRRYQQLGRLRTPALPGGLRAPPAVHCADDTRLLLELLPRDGPVAREVADLYCAASNAAIHPDKAVGLCMGSHPAIVGRDSVFGARFAQPGEPPIVALGVPCTTDVLRG